MGNDPLGLSPYQRAQSNQNAITEEFVRRFGDSILIDDDGAWYVESHGERTYVPVIPAISREVRERNALRIVQEE